jgi:hypothetical protein
VLGAPVRSLEGLQPIKQKDFFFSSRCKIQQELGQHAFQVAAVHGVVAVLVRGVALPGVSLVTWTLRPTRGLFTPGGCQLGYKEHAGCHQLNVF